MYVRRVLLHLDCWRHLVYKPHFNLYRAKYANVKHEISNRLFASFSFDIFGFVWLLKHFTLIKLSCTALLMWYLRTHPGSLPLYRTKVQTILWRKRSALLFKAFVGGIKRKEQKYKKYTPSCCLCYVMNFQWLFSFKS